MQLLDQYRQMHMSGAFRGLSVLKFADEIGQLVKAHGCETLLDYGAGQGFQYSPPHDLDKKWGVSVTCYDPAVPGMDQLPDGKFDMVLCSDVLEHVPLLEIPPLLHNVFSRAGKVVFLTVCTRPAKKWLPSGQNAHITLLPLDRWQEDIAEIAAGYKAQWVLRETP